jgi:hypothetical protein
MRGSSSSRTATVAILLVGACGRLGFPTGTSDAVAGDVIRLVDGPKAVTFDTATAGTSLCSSSPCTYTHEVGPGANSIIVIWYYCANNQTPATQITFDGAAAMYIGASNYTSQRGELWYARPTVSGSRTISLTSSCTTGYIASMSATNVDPATPFRATKFDGTDLSLPSISDSFSSAPGDLVMDGVCHGSFLDSPTGVQQGRYLQNITQATACGSFAGSTQPGASPTVSTLWSSTSADTWIFMGVSLQPAS